MADTNDILSRLGKVEDAVTEIKVDLAAVKERLTHVPTKHDIYKALFGAAFVLLATILGGAWWMIGQYIGPIINKLGI